MAKITAIGIDPGSQHTGYGVVSYEHGRFTLVGCGVIHTKVDGADFSNRLVKIYHALVDVIQKLDPDEAAIEQVFVSKNPQSALKLGQARGVAVAACAAYGLPVSDYAATQVKSAIVGLGHAKKEQVAFMVKQLLKIKDADWALDTSDALGLAICHLTRQLLPPNVFDV